MTTQQRFSFPNSALYYGTPYQSAYEIYTGVRQGIIDFTRIFLINLELLLVRPIGRAFGVKYGRAKARANDYATNNTLKVAVLGFGRTGTVSMHMALSQLGYNPYHTYFISFLADELEAYMEDFISPSIQSGHVQMNQMDLKYMVSQGFDALLDQPTYYYYEQMLAEYPDCKFILTTRESPEAWYQSFSNVMQKISPSLATGGLFLPTLHQALQYLRWGSAVVSGDDSYLTTAALPLPKLPREESMAQYLAHNERVRQMIPADRLLEFQVTGGWGPLCDFLQVADCPAGAFPRGNSKLYTDAYLVGGTIFGALMLFGLIPTLAYKLFNVLRERRRRRTHFVVKIKSA